MSTKKKKNEKVLNFFFFFFFPKKGFVFLLASRSCFVTHVFIRVFWRRMVFGRRVLLIML